MTHTPDPELFVQAATTNSDADVSPPTGSDPAPPLNSYESSYSEWDLLNRSDASPFLQPPSEWSNPAAISSYVSEMNSLRACGHSKSENPMCHMVAVVDGVRYEFYRPLHDPRGFHRGNSSYLKVCPWCDRQWAKVTSEHSRWHMVTGQSCAACGHEFRSVFDRYIPGSLLDEPSTNCQTIDWDIILWLPEALRVREFNVHVAYLFGDRPYDSPAKQTDSLSSDPEFAKYYGRDIPPTGG